MKLLSNFKAPFIFIGQQKRPILSGHGADFAKGLWWRTGISCHDGSVLSNLHEASRPALGETKVRPTAGRQPPPPTQVPVVKNDAQPRHDRRSAARRVRRSELDHAYVSPYS